MPLAYVTGATGFVGLNLVETLSRSGWRVVALVRPTSDLRYLSRFACERVEGSITDPESLRRTLPRGADVVFHVAGDTNMWSRHNDAQTRNNVEGTRNVVAAALERRAARLVHTSSIAAYGVHDGTITEETPQEGASSWICYLRTKALAEEEVRRGIERGLDAVIVNPANIVGPYDLRNWSTMVWLVARGNLPGAPPGRGSFAHVREVVRAHVAAAERGGTGRNYLLGGDDASYLEMIRTIGEITGRPTPRKATPAWLLRIAARVEVVRARLAGRTPLLTPEKAALVSASMVCSSTRAIRELDYRAASLREMLDDAVRWMRDEGRIPSD